MAEFLTPNCPLCGQPPVMAVGADQAFCGNDGCTLLLWDRSLSLDDNLFNAGVVKFPQAEGGDGA
jgi:ribosomal protein S27AE